MDKNWLLDNIVNQRDVHFRFNGASHWLKSLKLLLHSDQEIYDFYTNASIQKKSIDQDSLFRITKDLTMSLNYYESLDALGNLNDKRAILRIGIIAWYYGVYFSSKAMISATDLNCITETHTKTANLWYELISKRSLAVEPFNLNLSSLKKTHIDDHIKKNPSYKKPTSKKPRNIEQAKSQLLTNLKGTGHYYREEFEKKIKCQNKIDKFLTKKDKKTRDDILEQKACSFLHEAYRIRGKANYRDMDYL